MSATDQNSDPKTGPFQAVTDSGGHEHTLDSFRQAAVGNIESLFRHIALQRTVRALASARSVLVVGSHSAHSFATHLHHVAAMRFDNWHLVERHSAGSSRIWGALTEKDVVVAIAAQPYGNEDFAVARYARRTGARVVAVADRRDSPLASCADDILLFPVRGSSALPSYVGATALIEMLVGMTATRGNGTGPRRQA